MKLKDIVFSGFGLLFVLLAGSLFAFQPSGGYHLLRKVGLSAAPGGGEYFDYVTFDAASRRVYLSHGTEVKVLDADKDNVVGNITGLKVGDVGIWRIVHDLGGAVVIVEAQLSPDRLQHHRIK